MAHPHWGTRDYFMCGWLLSIRTPLGCLSSCIHTYIYARTQYIDLNATKWRSLPEVRVTLSYIWLIAIPFEMIAILFEPLWVLMLIYSSMYICTHILRPFGDAIWRTLAEVRVKKKIQPPNKSNQKIANRRDHPQLFRCEVRIPLGRILNFCFMASLYQTSNWEPRWFQWGSLQERRAIKEHEGKRRKRRQRGGIYVHIYVCIYDSAS